MNTEKIEKRIVNIIVEAKTREQVFEGLKSYLPRHDISECYLNNYSWLADYHRVNVYTKNNKEVKIFKHVDLDLRKKDIILKRISLYVMITNSFGYTYKIKIVHNFVY